MASDVVLARYAAAEQIASFDFYPWLVLMKAKGATKIVIDRSQPKINKFPVPEVALRFESIIEPGPALAGLPMRFGDSRPHVAGSAFELFPWVGAGKPIERLHSIKEPVDVKYTVTLRHSHRVPGRNSDDVAWRSFAEEIGATVIDDYYVRPIHLHDRVALYAGAKMNFVINSGISLLLSLTRYPVTSFVTSASHRGLAKLGILPGMKFPWMLETQQMIWEDDTLDNLRNAWRRI